MAITDPCVVRLLTEGGAIEVFGRKLPDGSWSFIGRGTCLEIEDDGNDAMVVGGIPRFTDLATALPPHWGFFTPSLVHPELRGWFRDRFDAAIAALPASQMERRRCNWQALFSSMPPDRWSEESF